MTDKTLETKTDQNFAKDGLNKKILLEITVSRDSQGLKIYLKSIQNWGAFIQENSGEVEIGKVKCFLSKTGGVEGVPGYFIASDVFEYNEYPNMNMLLAKNINNGVKFDFWAFPMSENKVKDWIDKFKKQTKILYLTYCKKLNITTIITTHTVEEENHIT
ncbi:MAG: hypothetical protein AABY22_02410 [Nanoarchaeota archaeon]|mgnify:CR=1 FL=1